MVKLKPPTRSARSKAARAEYLAAMLRESRGWCVRAPATSARVWRLPHRKRGLSLTVFAAVSANPLKIERMRALGAEVRLEGQDFDAAKNAARAFAAESGARFVEDSRDVETAEGAGTIGMESLRWPEPFDALLVPLGNGALLAGIARWVKAHQPATQPDRRQRQRCARDGALLAFRAARALRADHHHRRWHWRARAGARGAGRPDRSGGRYSAGGRCDDAGGDAFGAPGAGAGAGALAQSGWRRYWPMARAFTASWSAPSYAAAT